MFSAALCGFRDWKHYYLLLQSTECVFPVVIKIITVQYDVLIIANKFANELE